MYPFAGRLTSSPLERPPHHHYWGNFAIDHAARAGTAVHARFANPTGRLSLSLGGTFNPCRSGRSAGTGLIVHVAIDGRRVGSVYYAHLTGLTRTSGPISNGAKIASLWSGGTSGCWTGPHAHVEPKGSAGRACFVRRALNAPLTGGLALGVIGGGYATRDNQPCPPGAQTPPSGQPPGGQPPAPGGGAAAPVGSDVDGNGGADLVLTAAEAGGGSAAIVAVSTYGSFWLQPAWWRDAGSRWAGITPLAGDVDGDRRGDYVFLADAGPGGTRAYVARSTGGGFAPPRLWWDGAGHDYHGIKAALADVDGNGGADLVLTTDEPGGGTAAMVAVSTYESFRLQPRWWFDPGTSWSEITPLAGDVDGDRKADYIYLADAGAGGTRAYVARSTGGGFGPFQLWWDGAGHDYASIKAALGDVDGNGGADLVLTTAQAGGGSAAMVAVSTYGSFWLQPAWWSDPGTGWAGITPLAGDVDGDRKADYVFLADAGPGGTRAYVARSTGGGFAPPRLWWDGAGHDYHGIKASFG